MLNAKAILEFKYSKLEGHCSGAIFFYPGAAINRNRFNAIFSSLVTLVIKVGRLSLVTLFIQVSVRIDHLSVPVLRDASPTLYFQPGAAINRNRFNSIFSSLVTLVLQKRNRF